MPLPPETGTVSPVAAGHHAGGARLLRRVVAFAALAVFLGGMATAAGFGERVVQVAPFVGAAAGVAALAWIVFRLRPWRIARPVARGGRTATVAGARALGTSGRASARATRVGARGTAAATRRTSHAVATGAKAGRHWLWRPREPWRPPGVVERSVLRARVAIAGAIAGSNPARRRADEVWCELEAAAAERTVALARHAHRRVVAIRARASLPIDEPEAAAQPQAVRD
jgi:hypothetical protein